MENNLDTHIFRYRHALMLHASMFAGSSGSTGHRPRASALTICVINRRPASFSIFQRSIHYHTQYNQGVHGPLEVCMEHQWRSPILTFWRVCDLDVGRYVS